MRELNSQSGNGFTDTLVFLPLALFLLFVGTDLGLFFYDKGALLQAFEDGVSSQASYGDDYPLFVNERLDIQVNDVALRQVLEGIVKEVSTSVNSLRAGKDSFLVESTALLLQVDPNSGEILGHRVLLSTSGPGNFSLEAAAPKYPRKSAEQFISERLNSNFAIPVGSVVDPVSGQLRESYFENSLAIYVELTALTDSIAASAVKSTLGEYFALQQQRLFLARLQAR